MQHICSKRQFRGGEKTGNKMIYTEWKCKVRWKPQGTGAELNLEHVHLHLFTLLTAILIVFCLVIYRIARRKKKNLTTTFFVSEVMSSSQIFWSDFSAFVPGFSVRDLPDFCQLVSTLPLHSLFWASLCFQALLFLPVHHWDGLRAEEPSGSWYSAQTHALHVVLFSILKHFLFELH